MQQNGIPVSNHQSVIDGSESADPEPKGRGLAKGICIDGGPAVVRNECGQTLK